MQLHKIFIALFLLLAVPFILADESGSAGPEKSASENQHHEGDHGEAHHGLSPNAPVIHEIGPLQITNSMVVTIVVAFLIILVAQAATSNVQLIPSGLQNFVTFQIENLFVHDFKTEAGGQL